MDEIYIYIHVYIYISYYYHYDTSGAFVLTNLYHGTARYESNPDGLVAATLADPGAANGCWGGPPPLENSYDLGTAPNLQGSRKPLVNQKVNPLPTVTGRGQNPKYDKEKITSSFNRR